MSKLFIFSALSLISAAAQAYPRFSEAAFFSSSGTTRIADVWESCNVLPSTFAFVTKMQNVPMQGNFNIFATGNCSTPVWPNIFKGSFTSTFANGTACTGRMEAYAYETGELALRWIFTGGINGKKCNYVSQTIDSPYLTR
jgi:hypothetical protein